MISPPAASAAVSRSMRGNKGADTKPEVLLRRALRGAGYPGYRLHWKKAPGRPDIAYPGKKVAIFVHGCFWHRCPICNLPMPKTHPEYWEEKFCRNVKRDERNMEDLRGMGWEAVIVWECEIKRSLEDVLERLSKVLEAR